MVGLIIELKVWFSQVSYPVNSDSNDNNLELQTIEQEIMSEW